MKSKLFSQIINAMDANEIQAYYQPQYDANSGKIVSAEALVRWIKPDGIISPDQFIPELEKSSAINSLDWFMAEETCKTLQELGDSAIPIAVNFSRWHVKEHNFANKLGILLKKYNIPSNLLEVEITESALSIVSNETITEWANQLYAMGINIAIDDFGAGFTSLQFVKNVPAKFLKIDKAFLSDNCQDERGRGTLETVFYFANRLGLSTIAEGVETIEQFKFLQGMDVDRVQGFLFSKPLKKDDFLILASNDTAPVLDLDSLLKRKGTFSSFNVLLAAIKDEYPLIIYGNISKNSYYVMFSDENLEYAGNTAGLLDDLSNEAIARCTDDSKQIYKERLTRPALINFYKNGTTRINAKLDMYGISGEIEHYDTTIHLMLHPSCDDILMVGWSKIW